MRIDKDHSGTIDKRKLEKMTMNMLNASFDVDWKQIIDECDQTGNGKIDF